MKVRNRRGELSIVGLALIVASCAAAGPKFLIALPQLAGRILASPTAAEANRGGPARPSNLPRLRAGSALGRSASLFPAQASAIITPHDRIPDFDQNPTIVSAQTGLWSDPVTLSPGRVPPTSTINYSAGQTRANNAILALGPEGVLNVECGQGAGSVHVILDINGYFQ